MDGLRAVGPGGGLFVYLSQIINQNSLQMTTETNQKPNWFKRHPYLTGIGAIIIFIIIVGSIGGSKDSSSNNSTSAKQEQKVFVEVTATKLADDYIQNEVNADNLYKDKNLRVSGVVKDIGKDLLDNAYIVLNGNPSDYFTDVQCTFASGTEEGLASLKKGTRVVAEGVGNGKLGNVHLKKCSFTIAN